VLRPHVQDHRFGPAGGGLDGAENAWCGAHGRFLV
jgi:hypothetical protein